MKIFGCVDNANLVQLAALEAVPLWVRVPPCPPSFNIRLIAGMVGNQDADVPIT